MILTYGLSLAGRSHIVRGIVCQDAHVIRELKNDWTAVAIADGVGSAAHADVAAQIAVNTVIDYVDSMIGEDTEWDETNLKNIIHTGYIYSLENILNEAIKYGRHMREYSTTLTVAVYNGRNVVYGHIGDGGIIGLTYTGKYVPITSVLKGEEHNVVIPLRRTSEWVFGTSDEEFCALLLLTDGLLDIAQPSLLNGDIYVRFVQQFIDCNAIDISPETAGDYRDEVKTFLKSDVCKSITDDITIVGVINFNIKSSVRDEEYYREPDWKSLREEQHKKLYPQLYS